MKYNLWSEGYRTNGESAGASYRGEWEGETLRDAVILFRDSISDKELKETIDTERLTLWGCRFFDNETEARKAFG